MSGGRSAEGGGRRAAILAGLFTRPVGFSDLEGIAAEGAYRARGAANSIPSNLAEGHGVENTGWRLRYVKIAIGSSCELDTQIEIALRPKYTRDESVREVRATLDRAQKLLYGMKREKQRRLAGGTTALAIAICAAVHFP